MPTYEYACTKCGQHVEVFQHVSDEPLKKCGVCGGPLRKVFHPAGILFKGSGFYSTDNRAKESGDNRAKQSGEKSSGGEPSKTSEKSTSEKSTSGDTKKSGDSGSSKSSGDSGKKDSKSSGPKERSA